MRSLLTHIQKQCLSSLTTHSSSVRPKSYCPSTRYLLLLLLGLSMNWAQAQKTIQGQVLDALNKTPLDGVSVYFDGSSLGTITNAQGKFELTVPSSISAPLIVSYMGY
ncbi:MAG: carboxypeptidase-like regulatory domain-containing protein, partial [Flavobacteriia bacterium]|nr:carboxypeptidase-like regulatory domain-containing protein [Flavobacteriia bacterium]